MAGAGYKSFTSGDILTASQVNTFLMDQAVMTFASSGARGSAIASPSEGMVTYLQSTDGIHVYNGTVWKPAYVPAQASSAARDAVFTSPVQGDTVFRSDLGFSETYYALYNVSTNPGGATTAGWYPTNPISYTIAPGAVLNPLPTTVADIPGTTFTVNVPYSNMLCEIEYGAHAQINTAITVTLNLTVNGASLANTVGRNPTGSSQMDIDLRSWHQLVVASGACTVKLRGSAGAATAAVFSNSYWRITFRAPTKPLGL